MVGVEGAFEVVDFVGDEAGEGAVEGGDVAGAVGVLVFDVDGEGGGGRCCGPARWHRPPRRLGRRRGGGGGRGGAGPADRVAGRGVPALRRRGQDGAGVLAVAPGGGRGTAVAAPGVAGRLRRPGRAGVAGRGLARPAATRCGPPHQGLRRHVLDRGRPPPPGSGCPGHAYGRGAAERRLAAIAALHQPVLDTTSFWGPCLRIQACVPACRTNPWPCATAKLLGPWPGEQEVGGADV